MKDEIIQSLIQEELERQQNTIELIASENIVSRDVLEAVGSILTNKYAEGKPCKRFYNGCHVIDKIEELTCKRFQELFKTDYHVNVQPHSGAQANMAVFEALLNIGDIVLSMDLSNGGHLSHGSPVNYSGKHYKIISYGINKDGFIDYDEVERLTLEYKPKLIICGASNYSKMIDFQRFSRIANKIDAHLLADIAHIAGLIAGGQHPSPFGYADVVTTTTHKSLRGPRGGVIACTPQLANQIDKAVFPGIQGGPLEHVIAGKAVCFYEASQPEFKEYAKQIVLNAQTLCQVLIYNGFNIIGGMTQNHLMTVDLTNKGITGKDAADLLDKYGITVNKNTIPNDPNGPIITSGIRIGVPAVTTRGFKENEMVDVGNIISEIIGNKNNKTVLNKCRDRVKELCEQFPLKYFE